MFRARDWRAKQRPSPFGRGRREAPGEGLKVRHVQTLTRPSGDLSQRERGGASRANRLIHDFSGQDQDHGAIAHGGFTNYDLLAFFHVERSADVQRLRLAVHGHYG